MKYSQHAAKCRLTTNERRHRFLLGLAVSALTLRPGICRTQAELARFCDVHPEYIRQIEQRALRKLRRRLVNLRTELEA